jgi:hypothetical protein
LGVTIAVFAIFFPNANMEKFLWDNEVENNQDEPGGRDLLEKPGVRRLYLGG